MIKVKAFTTLFPSYKIFLWARFAVMEIFVDQFPRWSASLMVD